MISHRHADILKRIAPIKMLIRFEVKDGSIVLDWLGPMSEQYNERVWTRIKYLKIKIKNILAKMDDNKGLRGSGPIGLACDRINYRLKQEEGIIDVKPHLFSWPIIEAEVTIK